jgi:hypothetical protein
MEQQILRKYHFCVLLKSNNFIFISRHVPYFYFKFSQKNPHSFGTFLWLIMIIVVEKNQSGYKDAKMKLFSVTIPNTNNVEKYEI